MTRKIVIAIVCLATVTGLAQGKGASLAMWSGRNYTVTGGKLVRHGFVFGTQHFSGSYPIAGHLTTGMILAKAMNGAPAHIGASGNIGKWIKP